MVSDRALGGVAGATKRQEWRLVSFEPLDVLVNADGRSLDVGSWGQPGSIAPGAFAGCLRTEVLRRAGFRFGAQQKQQSSAALRAAKSIGVPGFGGETGAEFAFVGPFLQWWDEALFLPLPASRIERGFEGAALGFRSGIAPEHDASGSLSLLRSPRDNRSYSRDARWAPLERVLCELAHAAGEEPSLHHAWSSARLRNSGVARARESKKGFLATERRTGHRRTAAGVTEDGALFSRAVERFRSGGSESRSSSYAGLVAGMDDWLPTGEAFVARLGGDGHLVRVVLLPFTQGAELLRRQRRLVVSALPALRGLLLYLATPALFARGFAPEVSPAGSRLVAAAVARPQITAGWDLANSRPKPVRRAAPAGSVYYYEVEDAQAAVEWLEGSFASGLGSVSDFDGSLGFGWALPGVFDARSISKSNSDAQ